MRSDAHPGAPLVRGKRVTEAQPAREKAVPVGRQVAVQKGAEGGQIRVAAMMTGSVSFAAASEKVLT